MCLSKFSCSLYSAASQTKCMSRFLNFHKGMDFKKVGKNIPEVAVLIPFCDVNGCPSLLYTVRAANLRFHGGQVSFPGGRVFKGEDKIDTVLRETYDEIMLDRNKIEIWGQGNAFPGRNNEMLITPVIGCVQDFTKNDLKINTNEVSQIFSIPLEELCNPKNQHYTQFKNGIVLPVFMVDSYKIWGNTGYITHIFLSSLLTTDEYKNNLHKKDQCKDDWMQNREIVEANKQMSY